MAVISISEAARTWRMARSTLQRALQEGRLSVTVRADSSKGIDTAELIRVFGEAPVALQERGSSKVQRATPSATPLAADATIAMLQAQMTTLLNTFPHASLTWNLRPRRCSIAKEALQ